MVVKVCFIGMFLVVSNLYGQVLHYSEAIVSGDTNTKQIALVFTGHEYADGSSFITEALKKQEVKASFFLTGDFYRKYQKEVKNLKRNKHYLGAHSDKHLLYCSWENRDSLLISKEEFLIDLKNNYTEMRRAGIKKAKYFLPPYEWYNQTVTDWTEEQGLKLVNFTSGTLSHADYTTPSMSNYRSSERILESIFDLEKNRGLNGFILLLHIGTDPERTDKLYFHLPSLIQKLKAEGYTFKRIDELLK